MGGKLPGGVYATANLCLNGILSLSVEMDIACLNQSDADDIDTLPNPKAGAICPRAQRPRIVSLGIIPQPKELVILEVAVILLAAQAFAINRLAGIPYPLWRIDAPL